MFVKKFDSSLITSAGYSNKILTVGMKNGRAYAYFDVPRRIFDELCAAESKGQYFNEKIKGNYDSEEVNAKAI